MLSQWEFLKIYEYESIRATRLGRHLMENFIGRGSGEAVPQGLGMGWPELKDFGVAADFVDEPETIKLDEGTKL